MTTSNYSRLQDLYLLVTATDIINDITRQDLLEFLDVQIQIEEDVMFEQDVMYEPDTEAKYLDLFLKKNK